MYIEFQKWKTSSIGIIYKNLENYISSYDNKIINLNLIKEDSNSNDFNLFKDDDYNKCNINDVNGKMNKININYSNNINNINNNKINNINNINYNYKNKKYYSIIGLEDYEDYKENENEGKEKCLICLEEYEVTSETNYYIDCNCIIHGTCFDNYIVNSINLGKVPIKCPYCNKKDINEIYVKDSLIENKKNELIEKFDKFNMNYYLMQHPDDISCCPTLGCKYIFIHEDEDNEFECPLCEKEFV